MASILSKLKARQKVKQNQSSQPKRQKSTLPLIPQNNKYLASTTTGEIFQPIRVHYRVPNQEKLIKEFSKIQCIAHDFEQKRWVWLYVAEARKIRFTNQPPEKESIVIGEFRFKGANELVLNLRSCARATEAIVFFDRYLPRDIAKVTDITIINKLFDIEEIKSINSIDKLFERSDLMVRSPEEITQQLLEIKSKTESKIARLIEVEQLIHKLASEPEPEIEKFPANYYEDGIDSLKFALAHRQMIAMEHWKGNVNYKSMDAIQDMLKQAKR